MLTLATNSIPIIKKLTGSTSDSDQAGLRIADGEDADSLSVRVCPAPESGDVVLLHGGARVFLAPNISPRLENLELYAVAKNGDVHLALREHD